MKFTIGRLNLAQGILVAPFSACESAFLSYTDFSLITLLYNGIFVASIW